MRLLRKKGDHRSLETLSEYLDGRLSGRELEDLERHLEACSMCGEELESLQFTVGLLRRVPMAEPRRIFTLGEAPSPAPVRREMRVPAWAYGAAASVVVLFFAAVLSADLGGVLAQDVSVPEAPVEAAAPAAPEGLRTEVVRETEGVVIEKEVVIEQEAVETEMSAPSEVGVSQAAATPAVAAAEMAQDAAPVAMAPPPEVAPVAPEAVEEAVALPAPELAEATAEVESTASEAATAAGVPAEAPFPTPAAGVLEPADSAVPAPVGDQVAEPTPPEEAMESTPAFWRVLEGVLGAVALLVVAAAIWRLRRRGGRAVSR